MRTILVAIGLLAIQPAHSQDVELQNAYVALIQNYCKGKWKSDYVMVNHCADEQTLAMKKWTSAMPKLREGSDVYEIMNDCKTRWSKPLPHIDWVMTVDCTEKQIEALEKYRARTR